MNDRGEIERLRRLAAELLAELRAARRDPLLVRLADSQLDEIAERVYARVDERIAPREITEDVAPRRR